MNAQTTSGSLTLTGGKLGGNILADRFGRRCLNSTAFTEALKEPAVVCQDDANAMLRETGGFSKGLDLAQEVGPALILDDLIHGGTVARYSVQVNARNNVSAERASKSYPELMENGWFDRLLEVISEDDRSYSQLALDAKLGRNYVQQMIKNKKEPGSDRLAKLLDALGPNAATYVYLGVKADHRDIELLRLLSSAPAGVKDNFRSMLEALVGSEAS